MINITLQLSSYSAAAELFAKLAGTDYAASTTIRMAPADAEATVASIDAPKKTRAKKTEPVTTVVENTDADFAPQPDKQVEEPVAEAVIEAEPVKISPDDFIPKVKAWALEQGAAKAVELLKKWNVSKLSEIKQADYPAVLAEIGL